MTPAVAVLMATYGQAAFIPRAVASLRAQTLSDWELAIIDDGSPDDTAGTVARLPRDDRIRCRRLPQNTGLGHALNVGLDDTEADLVAYLPSDDVLRRDHLATLVALLGEDAVLAHTGRRPAGPALQLVQLLHRRTEDRWIERDELETDDLERLFLGALRRRGPVAATDRVTCEWTQHPRQRHRAMQERLDGGLNVFRHRYRVATPLRFAPSDGAFTDEVARYARWRDRPPPPRAVDGLRILLAGELAFNPDRIIALEDRGHELFGVWTDDPLPFNTVGPLPFGHVGHIPRTGWRAAVRAARPDVVYALLNWRAVPLAHEIVSARLGIRFVFHFKEAPQRCIARGEWPLLSEVVREADECIFASEEERAWFHAALPGLDPARTHAIDGDLPKREWLEGDTSPRMWRRHGDVHTVLVGRPYGWSDELTAELRARGVHVHVHAGPRSVAPEDWVRVLSRYDAGWLHPVRAANGGDIRAATWDDLNLPSRLPTLLAAGLPLIVPRSPRGSVHAAERVASESGTAILYDDLDELAAVLADPARMNGLRSAAWSARQDFAFDSHVDRLVDILRGPGSRSAG